MYGWMDVQRACVHMCVCACVDGLMYIFLFPQLDTVLPLSKHQQHVTHSDSPSVVIRPPNITFVDVDDTVEMVCVAYGNPIPTITWSRPGCFDLNNTDSAANIKISSKMVSLDNITFMQSMLQICRVLPEDGVQYTCAAHNGVSGTGIASSSVSFSLRVKQEGTCRQKGMLIRFLCSW